MSTVRFVLLLCLIPGFAACSVVEVHSERDENADFTKYKSWAWAPEKGVTKGSYSNIDIKAVDAEIKQAVETQMNGLGLVMGAAGSADLLVVYHLSLDEDMELQEINNAYYGRTYFGWGKHFDTPQQIPISQPTGSVVIDVIDAKTKKAVWRGTGKRILDKDPTPESTRETIGKAMAEIFARYPAK